MDVRCGQPDHQQSGPDGTSTYSYDATSQLTAADHDYQTDEAYDYDENGNRTSTGYQTGTNNRLLSDGKYDYVYDLEGNRTKRTEIATGDYIEYRWDHRNRLVAVEFRTSAGTLTKKVELDYDVYSRLIAKRVDDDGNGTFDRAQKFVYDALDIVLVYDDSGSLENRFLYGPALDQVFADEDSLGEVLWGLTDHLGTVHDVVEYDAGTDTTSVVNHVQYDAFGNITAQTDASAQPLLAFTGRYRDKDIGLQWNWNRWYDPTVGRWLSEDPIGFAGGDSNLGRYVANSPTDSSDPFGLWVWPWDRRASWNPRDTASTWTGGFFPNAAQYARMFPAPVRYYDPASGQIVEELSRDQMAVGIAPNPVTIIEGVDAGLRRSGNEYAAEQLQELLGNRPRTMTLVDADTGERCTVTMSWGMAPSPSSGSRPVFNVRRSQTPRIADNIEAAIAEGQPTTLTRIEGQRRIRRNRRAALDGRETADPTQSLDEYPFASTAQGGRGAQVRSVPQSEQNTQGGQLSQFYQRNRICDGDQFDVIIDD